MEVTGIWGWLLLSLLTIIFVLIIWGFFEGLAYLRNQKTYKLLSKAADIAYGAAEVWGKTYLSGQDKQGTEKAKHAFDVASKLLKSWKVDLSASQIESAVQLAWQKWEGSHKAAGSTAVINTEIAATPDHMKDAAREVIHEVLEKG